MYEKKIKNTQIKISKTYKSKKKHRINIPKKVLKNEIKLRSFIKHNLDRDKTSISFCISKYTNDTKNYLYVAKIVAEEILGYLINTTPIRKISLYIEDNSFFDIFKQTFSRHIEYIKKKTYRNPIPTVDIIIEIDNSIVLIERKNPPFGWAIPGGFVDYNESLENAAKREAKEETNLEINNLMQFRTYSNPKRDPRYHTISTVFIAKGKGKLKALTDAKNIKLFKTKNLPKNITFDHGKILKDYIKFKNRKEI